MFEIGITSASNHLSVHAEEEKYDLEQPVASADPTNIYDDRYLKALFDEMQNTYERVSTLTSFGFNRRWRQQLTERLGLQEGMCVGDLMAGSGESWAYLLPRIGRDGALLAVDFSSQMMRQANERRQALQADNIVTLHEDVFGSSIASGSLDAVVCVYGVKTLSPQHQQAFVDEIGRLLKPGGVFGLVEVSVPESGWLRVPYLFYLSVVVPIFGKLLLGNPDNYRMLGLYTAKFGDCRAMERLFAASGFETRYERFFWGCASGVVGRKL